MPLGKQDHYAAAFGGLNAIHFERDQVWVEPLNCEPEIERRLERRILLFFTGASRSAATILKGQLEATEQQQADVVAALHDIKASARATVALLRAGDLTAFGELLHQCWEIKKRLASGITTPRIDELYAVARSSGALGGKITGAGGGGFLMLYCQEARQEAVTTALEARGLVRTDFRFERGGAVILMDAIPRIHAFGTPERALVGVA
jgi:D-glycero-alpha-D-manno-heptose-7-phosphate kinase